MKVVASLGALVSLLLLQAPAVVSVPSVPTPVRDEWPVEGSHLQYHVEDGFRIPGGAARSTAVDIRMVYTDRKWDVACAGERWTRDDGGNETLAPVSNHTRVPHVP